MKVLRAHSFVDDSISLFRVMVLCRKYRSIECASGSLRRILLLFPLSSKFSK